MPWPISIVTKFFPVIVILGRYSCPPIVSKLNLKRRGIFVNQLWTAWTVSRHGSIVVVEIARIRILRRRDWWVKGTTTGAGVFGAAVGDMVGVTVGALVGRPVGLLVGLAVGCGVMVGANVGLSVGSSVLGAALGGGSVGLIVKRSGSFSNLCSSIGPWSTGVSE